MTHKIGPKEQQRIDLRLRRYERRGPGRKIDTSDIPETGEAWFRNAKLVLPKQLRKLTEASASKPINAPVQASAQRKEMTMSKKSKTKKRPAPKAKKRGRSEASANLRKAKTKTPPASDDGPAAGPRELRAGSKLAIVVDLLKRSEGCTTKDVLEATGWPTVSMPQQAKAAGLVLKKEKDGPVTRYRAEAA